MWLVLELDTKTRPPASRDSGWRETECRKQTVIQRDGVSNGEPYKAQGTLGVSVPHLIWKVRKTDFELRNTSSDKKEGRAF